MTARVQAHLYSRRDQQILTLVRRAPRGDFAAAVEQLQRAVEAVIPAGRVWFLGETERGPVVGSLISGIGITPGAAGRVHIVHLKDGLLTELEAL